MKYVSEISHWSPSINQCGLDLITYRVGTPPLQRWSGSRFLQQSGVSEWLPQRCAWCCQGQRLDSHHPPAIPEGEYWLTKELVRNCQMEIVPYQWDLNHNREKACVIYASEMIGINNSIYMYAWFAKQFISSEGTTYAKQARSSIASHTFLKYIFNVWLWSTFNKKWLWLPLHQAHLLQCIVL